MCSLAGRNNAPLGMPTLGRRGVKRRLVRVSEFFCRRSPGGTKVNGTEWRVLVPEAGGSLAERQAHIARLGHVQLTEQIIYGGTQFITQVHYSASCRASCSSPSTTNSNSNSIHLTSSKSHHAASHRIALEFENNPKDCQSLVKCQPAAVRRLFGSNEHRHLSLDGRQTRAITK